MPSSLGRRLKSIGDTAGIGIGIVVQNGSAGSPQLLLGISSHQLTLIRIDEAGTEHVLPYVSDVLLGAGGRQHGQIVGCRFLRHRFTGLGGDVTDQGHHTFIQQALVHGDRFAGIALFVIADVFDFFAAQNAALLFVDFFHRHFDGVVHGGTVLGHLTGQRGQAADLDNVAGAASAVIVTSGQRHRH